MALISKIKVGSITYDIKDTTYSAATASSNGLMPSAAFKKYSQDKTVAYSSSLGAVNASTASTIMVSIANGVSSQTLSISGTDSTAGVRQLHIIVNNTNNTELFTAIIPSNYTVFGDRTILEIPSGEYGEIYVVYALGTYFVSLHQPSSEIEACVRVDTLPSASAATMGKIYLEGLITDTRFDRYITTFDGTDYDWLYLGSTSIDFSDYYTKTESDAKFTTFEETTNPDYQEVSDEYARLISALYQAIEDAQNARADYIGEDSYVYRWDAAQGKYIRTNMYVKGDAGTTDYNQLLNKPTIPTALSELGQDSTHRTVTDAEKAGWLSYEENNDPMSLLE